MLNDEGCNSVVSGMRDDGRFWSYNKLRNKYTPFYPKKRINRQYYEPLFREDAAIYFSKYNIIMKKNKLVDDKYVKFVIMDPDEIIDLDTPNDWKNAEEKIKNFLES